MKPQLPSIEKYGLPEELVRKTSDLAVLVTITGQALDEKSFGYQAMSRDTRRMCHNACPQYKPCLQHQDCVLCRSGMDGRILFRGMACHHCTLYDPQD